jgi:flagellin-specific chaperone FliS
MTSSVKRYSNLLRKLVEIRKRNNNKESEEEDTLLDEMEELWWEMTEDEHEITEEQKNE